LKKTFYSVVEEQDFTFNLCLKHDYVAFSLWLLIDADLGSSEKTVANFPAGLHHVAHRVFVLISDTLLNHKLRVMNIWVKFLVNWVELDYFKLR